jgi:HAD superfamily hydrolase (TIGR01509 family)
MDGTLVDTLPAHYEAWLKAGEEFGITFSMEYFQALTGRPARELGKDIVKKFDLPISSDELVRRKEALVKEQFHKVKVFKPILEVIKNYHTNIPMAVGTGARKEMANSILIASQLKSYFDLVVTSDDVQNYKPHPETFMKSAEHFGIKPENCLVFEDGYLGIEAAKKAGMMVIDVKPFYI